MSYEKTTIKETIEKINSGEMYLPAIQRQYVWREDQITKFFNSIMRGYPIGTFLYWEVTNETIHNSNYKFYKFIQDYHERDKNSNEPAPHPIIKDKIIGVLDGQQRLTSLYVALQGSLSFKLPKKRAVLDTSFPKKELYFNLDQNYDHNEEDTPDGFEFRTENQPLKDGEDWIKVKDLLTFRSTKELFAFTTEKMYSPKSSGNIGHLWQRLCSDELINVFRIKDRSLEDVLEIFVRVNSGGTVLSKIDLLFSTIVSQWVESREKIEVLIKSINKIGEKYNFNNDLIMRICLYLLDQPTNLKIENFKSQNISRIETDWDNISESIVRSVELLSEFGLSGDNLVSYNVILPLVYYIHKKGRLDDTSKFELRKYLVLSQVYQVFGGSSNYILSQIRNELRIGNENEGYQLKSTSFEFKHFQDIKLSTGKLLSFNKESIKELLEHKKGMYTYLLLTLLYPDFKYSQKSFHQDHMHPLFMFAERELTSEGIPQEQWFYYKENCNKLPNLQILEGRDNSSKSKEKLAVWAQKPENKKVLEYIDQDVSLSFDEFKKFYENRKTNMYNKLVEILIKNDGQNNQLTT